MEQKAIPQQEFQNVSNNGRQHCWAKCIAVQVEYFEGDSPQKAVSIQVCLE